MHLDDVMTASMLQNCRYIWLPLTASLVRSERASCFMHQQLVDLQLKRWALSFLQQATEEQFPPAAWACNRFIYHLIYYQTKYCSQVNNFGRKYIRGISNLLWSWSPYERRLDLHLFMKHIVSIHLTFKWSIFNQSAINTAEKIF